MGIGDTQRACEWHMVVKASTAKSCLVTTNHKQLTTSVYPKWRGSPNRSGGELRCTSRYSHHAAALHPSQLLDRRWIPSKAR